MKVSLKGRRGGQNILVISLRKVKEREKNEKCKKEKKVKSVFDICDAVI